MKWIELNDKKYPEFNKEVLYLDKTGDWGKGKLDKIDKSAVGSTFYFEPFGSIDNHQIVCSHYMEIELPK